MTYSLCIITYTHIHIQNNYHRSGVHHLYTKSHLLIHIHIHIQLYPKYYISFFYIRVGEHLTWCWSLLPMWAIPRSSFFFDTYTDETSVLSL